METIGRRALLGYAAGAAAVAALGPLAGCSDSSPSGEKKGGSGGHRKNNILVVYSDDQRYDTVRFMPTLQRLQARGTTFTQARLSTPLCTPSRATLLSGQYAVGPHGHGVTGNDDRFPRRLADDSLAAWLHAAGYHCGLIGKYFDQFQALRVPHGWSTWRALVKGRDNSPNIAPIQDAHSYGVFDGTHTRYPHEHQMELVTGEVLDFIDAAPEPWFLWDTLTSPHYPPQPTPRRAHADVPADWPVVGEDTSTKPSWMAALPPYSADAVARTRGDIQNVLREVIDVDDHLAAVWAQLEKKGLADRTTILYASDNGTAFLDYRLALYTKNLPYDVSSRVPLVGIGPGFAKGEVVHAPVSTAIDITATCLAVAGAKATRPQDGVSLTTHADPKRVTRGSCAKVPGAKPEVPTNDWIIADLGDGLRKVIRYHGATGADAVEAYDLDTDPHELVNWGNDPARQDERATLLKELDAQLA